MTWGRLTFDGIHRCMQSAQDRLIRPERYPLYRIIKEIRSWYQTWGSSACGFSGGLAMQAFGEAPTTIVIGVEGDVVVFHNHIYAYYIKEPTPRFWDMVADCSLPGASDRGRLAMLGASRVAEKGEV